MVTSPDFVPLQPTSIYYLRKLVRQNLDQLESVLAQDINLGFDPVTDLNAVLAFLYQDPESCNSVVQELERLVKYHQALSSQGGLHRKELTQTADAIFAALGLRNINELTEIRAKILIVDDRPENIRLLALALNRQGYAVESLGKSQNALLMAQTIQPDIILLDIMMPGLDGYEVCRQLKEEPLTSAIPVIFVSAVTNVVDKVKGFRAGAVDYITKPFQFDEVLARIEHQLKILNLTKRLEETSLRLQKEVHNRQKDAKQLMLYRETLDGLSNYNFFLRPDGQLILGSEYIGKYLGYAPAELKQMKLYELDNSLTEETWKQQWAALKREGYLQTVTYHRKQDKDILPVQVSLMYLPKQGVAYGYVHLYTPPVVEMEPVVAEEPAEAIAATDPPGEEENTGVSSWRQWRV